MNKTQRLHREIMGKLMQHLNKNDAEYFANWLLEHYKISEYKDVQPLNVGQSDTKSQEINK